jgi:hypothetical protein
MLVGLRDGSVLKLDINGNEEVKYRSHSDGETWGLAVADDGKFVTSGDDN